MQTFETSTTVEDQGQVRLVGVPFEPGTRVDVTVTPTSSGADVGEQERTARLLAALAKGRNTQPVGPLRRTDLYDRDILH